MEGLPALAVAVPLVGATVALATAPWTGWRLRDGTGIAVAVATAALTIWLTTSPRLLVSWMGGWEPVRDLAIGIALVVDPFSAGLAGLAGVLTAAALVFSWRYFEAIGALFHTLMLLFLGGMVGFALTGDLFNLFVFFELLTTAAYALTAYHIEREGPLQGSINFAVTNTIGAFLILHGIGILYARTGALNLAEIGMELRGTSPDLILIASFTLISVGLFTKAAIVPFHFWLADAHAVAPTPVSVLLSGVMIQLGLYGWMRVYWSVYALPFHDHVDALRVLVVALGIATAVIAAAFALAQHHLKRLLAFSSVSHSGLILIGIGLLDRDGLAGAGLYTLAHGGVKGALFLLAGIVLHHHGSVDEIELHGRGRRQPLIAALFALGALALAGLPPFGTTLGEHLIDEGARAHGLGPWVLGAFVLAGALTGAAVLRATGRIFLGWGPRVPAAEELGGDEDEERETTQEPGRQRTPLVMVAPAVALIAGALALGLVPTVSERALSAAAAVVEPTRYLDAVMTGATVTFAPARAATVTVSAAAIGLTSSLLAVALAGITLSRPRLPAPLRRATLGAARVFDGVRRLQSGHVGDYVAWMTFGTALLGAGYILVLR